MPGHSASAFAVLQASSTDYAVANAAAAVIISADARIEKSNADYQSFRFGLLMDDLIWTTLAARSCLGSPNEAPDLRDLAWITIEYLFDLLHSDDQTLHSNWVAVLLDCSCQ